MSLRHRKSRLQLSNIFNSLFQKNERHERPGIYWITPSFEDRSVTQDQTNDVVQDVLVHHFLAVDAVTAIVHLSNTNPAARNGNGLHGFKATFGGPTSVIVRVGDIQSSGNLEVPLSTATMKLRGCGSSGIGTFGAKARVYEHVQSFEGQWQSKPVGSCIVAVAIEPAEGQDADLDAWYRKEHLKILAKAPSFLRSTRYKLVHGHVDRLDDETPRYLALHEYSSVKAILDHAVQKGSLAPETPWSARVLDNAKKVERTIWDMSGRYSREASSGEVLQR